MKSYSCVEHSRTHAVDFFHRTAKSAVLDLLMHHAHRRPINCLCNESSGRFRISRPLCSNLTAPATLNAVNCDLNPSYDAHRTVWHKNVNVTEECHRQSLPWALPKISCGTHCTVQSDKQWLWRTAKTAKMFSRFKRKCYKALLFCQRTFFPSCTISTKQQKMQGFWRLLFFLLRSTSWKI